MNLNRSHAMTAIVAIVATLLLFGGSAAPPPAPILVNAQSASPRSDLVTGFRQDVAAFNTAMDSFIAHRAEYVARNIDFVIGDMIGPNSSGAFIADDVDQAVIDFNDLVTKVRAGGTISVGVWNNVIKVK